MKSALVLLFCCFFAVTFGNPILPKPVENRDTTIQVGNLDPMPLRLPTSLWPYRTQGSVSKKYKQHQRRNVVTGLDGIEAAKAYLKDFILPF